MFRKFVRKCASVARPARNQIQATYQENVSFADFNLSSQTSRGVSDILKLTTPTQAQVAFIPAVLSQPCSSTLSRYNDSSKRFVTKQKHFFLQAPNGTGKTVACLIPLLEKVLITSSSSNKKGVKALVVCLSWELVWQMGRCLDELSTFHGYKVQCFTGGEETENDLHTLKFGADVIVGTPGRLLKILENGDTSWDSVSYILCDEADRVLASRNQLCVESIVSKIRAQGADPQLVFTSATTRQSVLNRAQDLCGADIQQGDIPWPQIDPSVTSSSDALDRIRSRHKNRDSVQEVTEDSEKMFTLITCPEEIFKRRLVQEFTYVQAKSLPSFLYSTLENAVLEEKGKVVVFCQTSALAQLLSRAFQSTEKLGEHIFCIHSEMRQWSRAQQYRQFELAKAAVLFSSGAVTRGMDFPGVGLVVQVGPVLEGTPQYSHQVGRTARAGKPGRSLLILNELLPTDVKFVEQTLAYESISRCTKNNGEEDNTSVVGMLGSRKGGVRNRLQSEYSESEELSKHFSSLQELGNAVPRSLINYYEMFAREEREKIICFAKGLLDGLGLKTPKM